MAAAAPTYQQLTSGGISFDQLLSDANLSSLQSQEALANAGAGGGENNSASQYMGSQGLTITDSGTKLGLEAGYDANWQSQGLSSPITFGFQDPTNANLNQTFVDKNGKISSETSQFQGFNSWTTFFDALALPAAFAGGIALAGAGAADAAGSAAAGSAAEGGGVAASAAPALTATQADLAAGTYGDASLADFAGGATASSGGSVGSLYQQMQSALNNPAVQGVRAANSVNQLIGALGGGQQSGSNMADSGGLNLGQIISGGLGIAGGASTAFGGAASNIHQSESIADPYQEYRAGDAAALNSLVNNPGQFTSSPMYQALFQQGNAAVNAGQLASGDSGSINQAYALQQNGMATANAYYQQDLGNLEQLSGESKQNMGISAGLNAGIPNATAQGGSALGSGISSLLNGLGLANSGGGLSNLWNSLMGGGSSNPDYASNLTGIGTQGASSGDVANIFGQNGGYDLYSGEAVSGGSGGIDVLGGLLG